MTRDTYARLRKLKSLANVPEDTEKLLDGADESEIAKNVWNYYEDSEDIHAVGYKINATNNNYEVRSNLGIKPDGQFPVFESVESEHRYFSEYEDKILDEVGLDKDKHWNGNLADVRYTDGGLFIGETDYYSTAPLIRLMSAEVYNDGGNPLRDELLSTMDDLECPLRPLPSTSGGVMVANKGDDDWVLLIGKRSEDTHVNSGMFSIFPNGKCEYGDLSQGFEKTVEREFREEIFSEQKKGEMFYKKHVDTNRILAGWNLRSGSFTVSHALVINSRVSYDVLNEISEHNDEIEKIIEVPVDDISMIAEKANLDNMSASAVSTVFETLLKMDESDRFPDLPYDINRV